MASPAGASAWISHLGTAVPGPAIAQADFTAWLAERLPPGADRARFERLSARSGVRTRHSVLDLFGSDGDALARGAPGARGTASRSQLYRRHALPLALQAVQALGADAIPPGAITHLIVATCTGAIAPGLDLQLAQALGLSPTVRRTVVGFMGCYAAIPALRIARDACCADPHAQVLVVCCELCSLHLGAASDHAALVAACLFADGASAAVVHGGPQGRGLGLRIVADAAAIIPDSGDHMAWYAGDQGFVIGLSPAITGAIAGDIRPLVARLLDGRPPQATAWAVHPGGPRILDGIEQTLELADGALDRSRAALANGGNRSSATVLAILADHLRGPAPAREIGLLAFGPGLTAEALLVAHA